jgi:hypothetical protein
MDAIENRPFRHASGLGCSFLLRSMPGQSGQEPPTPPSLPVEEGNDAKHTFTRSNRVDLGKDDTGNSVVVKNDRLTIA